MSVAGIYFDECARIPPWPPALKKSDLDHFTGKPANPILQFVRMDLATANRGRCKKQSTVLAISRCIFDAGHEGECMCQREGPMRLGVPKKQPYSGFRKDVVASNS